MSLRKALSLELLDNRYPSLHGLRVLAIVSVVQVHVTWMLAQEDGISLNASWVTSSLAIFFGMDLFFILSGFLIGSILLRSIETNGTQNLRRFYIRRAARTFPPYYVVLTFLALTTALTASQREHVVWEYVYATNFMPLKPHDVLMPWGWSLALEEQFYLTVPLLLFVLHRLRSDRGRLTLLGVVWSAALVMRIVAYVALGPWKPVDLYDALYFRPLTRFDTLIAGVALAIVHRRYREPISRWLDDPRNRAILALPSLACLWVLVNPDMFGTEHSMMVHVFAWGTITSVMYFGWLLLLLHREGPVGRALSRPLFRSIATLGYGVYLVHIPLCEHVVMPLARALEARHVSAVLIWPTALGALLVISTALAYVLHLVVEKPSLWLRQRVAA